MTTPYGERDAALQVTSPRFQAAAGSLNNATVFIFTRTTTNSAPALPSLASSLDFTTGVVTNLNNSWGTSIPAASNGGFLWVSIFHAAAIGSTITIQSTDWTAPQLQAQDGVTRYTWIKYGTSSAGAGISDDPSGKAYMGIAYNKLTATASTDPADYVWALIQGANGTAVQGDPGARGAGSFYVTGSAWTDAAADAATPGATVVDDIVTISNGTNFIMVKKYTGSAWNPIAPVYDGGAIFPGTVTANQINSNGLSVRKSDGTLLLDAGGTLQPGAEAPGTKNSDIIVGGRNLYPDSGFERGTHPCTSRNLVTSFAINSNPGGTGAPYAGSNALYFGGSGGDMYLYLGGPTCPVIAGKAYTISFMYKTNASAAITANSSYVHKSDGGHDAAPLPVLATSGVWTLCEFPWTCPAGVTWIEMRFGLISSASIVWMAVDCIQVEEGNKRTQWNPAPEDFDATISAISIGTDGTLTGAGGGQATLSGMGLKNYRVVAAGASSTSTPAGIGLYLNGAIYSGAQRSYILVVISRSTGLPLYSKTYDVFGVGAVTPGFTAATLAADLTALGSDKIVVVYTSDEPQSNRQTSGLDTAMYRCGASRAVFGSPAFQYRSAYILVGIPGCGEGNGAEAYQGTISLDPNAWCDIGFSIVNGNLTGVSTSYTPKTLTDYGYTGDLNANYVTNTNQLADGAGLGTTAVWATGISGRPADSELLNSYVLLGGTNLLRYSGQFKDGMDANWLSNGGGVAIDGTIFYGGFKTLRLGGNGGAYNSRVMRLKPNTLYTVSAMVRSDAIVTGSSISQLHVQVWTDENSSNAHQEIIQTYDQAIPTINVWKKVWCTFATPSSATMVYHRLYFYPLSGVNLWIGYAKVEEGNKSTDWSPAPEDVMYEIDTIANDNVLSRGEKPQVMVDWQAIDSEANIYGAQANALGVSTTSYTAAYSALGSYLASVNYANTSIDSTIDGPTFRQKFNDYYTAKSSLQNAISAAAATKANWANVSGSGKPADNATVGAPAGTNVGGTASTTVESWAYNGALSYNAVQDATTGLNARLRANADNVLGGILSADVVSAPVGFRAGTLTWDASGNRTGGYGVAITPKGLVGYKSDGTLTMSIDATTGAAVFAGSLSAATGTFAGSLSAVTGTFAGSLSAATGSFAGNLSGASGTFSGTLTASQVITTGNIADDAISTADVFNTLTNSGSTFVVASASKVLVTVWLAAPSLSDATSATIAGFKIMLGGSTIYSYQISGFRGDVFEGKGVVLSLAAGTYNISSVYAQSGTTSNVVIIKFKK